MNDNIDINDLLRRIGGELSDKIIQNAALQSQVAALLERNAQLESQIERDKEPAYKETPHTEVTTLAD